MWLAIPATRLRASSIVVNECVPMVRASRERFCARRESRYGDDTRGVDKARRCAAKNYGDDNASTSGGKFTPLASCPV